MNPMNVLEDIEVMLRKFRDNRISYSERDSVIVGILFADAREPHNISFMEKYINTYDEESGCQFDFFIPGYGVLDDGWDRKSPNAHVFYDSTLKKPVFHMDRTGLDYYFQKENYDNSVKELCKKLSIKERELGKNNPVLFLTEIDIRSMDFRDYILIDMRADEDMKVYTRLFEEVFRLSAASEMKEMKNRLFWSYFTRSRTIKNFAELLQGSGLAEEAFRTVDGIWRFRIRKNPKGINRTLL